jgi:predicted DNA-binding transcriptional regulator AlpA
MSNSALNSVPPPNGVEDALISQNRPATNNTFEPLLNEYAVARITGLSVASVRRWRLLRQGPRYLKIGSAVRYRREDIGAWIETRPSGGQAVNQ